jgi:hypothetical protein
VDVPGGQGAAGTVLRREQRGSLPERLRELAGLGDAGQVYEGAPQPVPGGRHGQGRLGGGHPQRHPAAVCQPDSVLAVEQFGDLGVGDPGDDDPVSLQVALGDRPAEWVRVGDLAEHRGVIGSVRGTGRCRPCRPSTPCSAGA